MRKGLFSVMGMGRLVAVVPFAAALLCIPTPGLALPILPSDLASFAVLGASIVNNTPTSDVDGNVGVSPGLTLPGFSFVATTITADPQVSGLVHSGTTLASSAQGQLTTARTNLGSILLPLTNQLLVPELAGLSLSPGVYSFSSFAGGVASLSGSSGSPGILTLNGGGNLNAAWVFEIDTTLTTSAATAGTTPSSVVNVINTGSGAGVFWNVGTTATIGSYSTFQGNILALTTINLGTGATIGCGRALANVAAVNMDQNTVNSIGCAGTGEEGSNGLSGGLDVTTGPSGGTVVSFLPFAPVPTVPEPATLTLLAIGLVGAARSRWTRRQIGSGRP